MIVNLKYVKKQWQDFPLIGNSHFSFDNPGPLKMLCVLTIFQCWCQLFWIVWLTNICLIKWDLETDENLITFCTRSVKCIDFYLYLAQMFQIFDMLISVWASYHLRISSSIYSNTQSVNLWAIVNEIYIITSIFLIFLSTSNGIEYLCTRSIIICLFAIYKIHILYTIYKYERSSHIVLEQRPPIPSNGCTPISSDEENQLLFENYMVEIGTDEPESLKTFL